MVNASSSEQGGRGSILKLCWKPETLCCPWMFMSRVKTLTAWDCHWRNLMRKKLESATIGKRACQCTDGLSATKNDRGAAGRFSTLLERTHVAKHTEKNCILLITFCNPEPNFLVQLFSDFSSWISRAGSIVPLYFKILDSKPFIDTYYSIGHRLELKYFHFAQFLLYAHWAAHWPQKSENWKLET